MAMLSSRYLLLLTSVCLVAGQRPSFAGLKPIGFPELQNKTNDDLGNRFGDDGGELPLPIEAKGDRDLVYRISKLPVDKQPFWYINWKALEDLRRNPQTYEQRPNVFAQSISSNTNTNRNQNANMNRNQAAPNFNPNSSKPVSDFNAQSSTDLTQEQTQVKSRHTLRNARRF